MIQYLLKKYERLFSNTHFYKLNKFLFVASAKGLGFDNSGAISEKGESAFLKSFFTRYGETEKLVVFDIGANVGHYATKIKRLNPDVQLYAFEPHPETFKLLQKTAHEYGITAVNKGCGETTGTIKFYDYSEGGGSEHATMIKGVLEDIHHSKSKELEVSVITVDEFASTNQIYHIHLLKIDTEGYEFSVLKGCTQLLDNKHIDVIHFEFNSMNMMSKVFFFDFVKLLHNYKLFRIVSNGLVPIDIHNHLLSEVFVFQNVIALKR